MATGLAKNFATILVCRFLAGTFGAPAVAVGAGTIADIWNLQRGAGGLATILFVLAPFAGSAIGPLIGGYTIDTRKDWQWLMWVLILVAGPVWLMALVVSETSKKELLRRRAIARGHTPPPKPPTTAFLKALFVITLFRPLRMLIIEPIVSSLSLYVSFVFGVMFAFFDAYPYVFQSVYAFSLGQVGLAFVSIVIGFLFAVLTSIVINKTLFEKSRKEAGPGILPPPEKRLYVSMVGSVGIPVSLFWFAWTAKASIHWIVPILAGIPFGWGNVCLFLKQRVDKNPRCRLPGGASDTSKLWNLLKSGRSGQCEIPKSRFNADAFFNKDPDFPGSIHSTGGYFIEDDVRLFENAVFGINNLEASYMDAQQRQLLEVVFECFETAGATIQNLSGTNVGCYVANFTTDFVTMQAKGPESFHRYSATGFGPTILANRISHVFNLKGPSFVMDTACSSSLYALHTACQGLRLQECDAAVVAGANLVQSPESYIAMVKAGVLSASSTSHTFDSSADGYGRGEGIGALYLKRLSDAIRENDPIRGVIRGTAAHGTGTPRGDPIEVEALSCVLQHKSGRATMIGSVKTNLGHSEAVSGILSVIKVALALENRLIPSTIGIRHLNPELKLEERNIEVVTTSTEWPEEVTPRASVNSFGYGGANAHAIIESASLHVPEAYRSTPHTADNSNTYLLPFSARTLKSLQENVKAVASSGLTNLNITDLTYTLGSRRSRFPTRGYMLVNPSSLFNSSDHDLQILRPSTDASPRSLAFIFNGQGTQYPEMGEIAAAFASGYLTAEEAIMIAYYRGLTASELDSKGAMLAVGLDHQSAEQLISSLDIQDNVCIACINSPKSTTISGNVSTVEQLFLVLQDQGIFARRLETDDKAYHSPAMRVIGHRYEALLSELNLGKNADLCANGTVKMFSCVLQKVVSKSEVISPQYWRKNLESPVLFSDTLEELLLSDEHHLIEVGPHPALRQPVRDVQDKAETSAIYFSTLSRYKNDEQSMLKLVGDIYLHGHEPIFENVNEVDSDFCQSPSRPRVLSNLPHYSWDYGPIMWKESRVSSEYRQRAFGPHELLGSRVPGGSKTTASWRNLLRMNEAPWLQDHRLGGTTVFPAAGYLAMAIEALLQECQASHYSSILFKQVHLKSLLVLPHEKEGVEIFTSIKPNNPSSITSSNSWWDFEIASYAANVSTLHVTGSIRISTDDSPMKPKTKFSEDSFEEQASRTWYDKLNREGLCFGPAFRSLSQIFTDRSKKMSCAVAKTILFQKNDKPFGQRSSYIVHPVNIDAMLQAGIIASASGTVGELRSKIPVLIDCLKISAAIRLDASNDFSIRGSSESVGFGTAILSADFESRTGQHLMQMSGVRVVAYVDSLLNKGTVAERHPALRILWKPDISTFESTCVPELTKCIRSFASQLPVDVGSPEAPRIAAAIDLLVHKNPRMRILELSSTASSRLAGLLNIIGIGPPQKRFESYVKCTLDPTGGLSSHEVAGNLAADERVIDFTPCKLESIYDIVIVTSVGPPGKDTADTFDMYLDHLSSNISVNTIFVFTTGFSFDPSLFEQPLDILHTDFEDSDVNISIARPSQRLHTLFESSKHNYIMVVANRDNPLNHLIAATLSEALGFDVQQLSLNEGPLGTVAPGSIVITTLELEEPLLADMTDHQMQMVKRMIENASILLWVTGGALFKAQRPLFALVLGLARTVMLERPALKMPVLDLDNTTLDLAISAQNVVLVLRQAMHSPSPESEYRQQDGVLHISRLTPDRLVNQQFRQTKNAELASKSLESAGNCQLNIRDVGQIDTLHFKQQPAAASELPEGNLEVQVKAIGLNAKGYYAVSSRTDTKNSTFALEFSGIVTRTASNNSKFMPGDRIVVMAPSQFAAYEWVPEFACCKLQPHEEFTTILIHSAAGGLGMAAVQIAQLKGAEIFATVGTDEKKRFLVEKFNIPEDHIFNSRNSSFRSGILAATENRGVDVVLNSLTGDAFQDSLQLCAEFGRFVEVGKMPSSEYGSLDKQIFSRGVTITAFDLTSLYWSKSKAKRQIWAEIGDIEAIKPLKIFSASEVVQAFRYFALGTRLGKVAISFEDLQTQIQVLPIKSHSTFSNEKAYILVGCLGGLGRSMSRWMLERGMRNFVYLGRSGTDRPSAKNLVQDLEAAGANVIVVRGDVTVFGDVDKTIAATRRVIGGVVHAAMGIHVRTQIDRPLAEC
ncbi:hypothetical protein HO133_003432 [Letharia lupina]|uniref:Uncharacterized protein n=1 Tax=Letharia lupina TaxID=560253 RepID=A0A8H6CBC1_9LECA|nr:uncharacterized protein HO133_003432 [Letharia lupina]KAF6220300.1 hypothetical protein HO133_003432 [Letharia lupina]